jgi:hypothetical protein
MSHELFLNGMFDAGEFGTGENYNRHHDLNRKVIEQFPVKAWPAEEASLYIHRGMFNVVDGTDSFRSQVIHFGNSFKETQGFIDD